MARSSINLKLAKIFAFLHNTRESIVTYTIDDASRNDYDKSGHEALRYFLDLIKEASSNYTKRTKQRIQTDEKKFLWEAVVNLNDHHELSDLEGLTKVLESIYGWQPVQISLHRDEGYKDEKSGKNIYNLHGHIVFFMLDKEGIYRFKKRDFGVKRMQELQTIVANILNMERGLSKKKTKRERLEHREYKQVKQTEQKMLNKYDVLVNQTNFLSLNIAQLKRNKKKTAKVLRNKDKTKINKDLKTSNESNIKLNYENRELNTGIQRSRDFFDNLLKTLNQHIDNYPLISLDDISDEKLIEEWVNEAQHHILSLVSERDELINEAYKMITVHDEFTLNYSEFPMSYKDLYEEKLKKNDVYEEELNQERIDKIEKPLKKEQKKDENFSNNSLKKGMGFEAH